MHSLGSGIYAMSIPFLSVCNCGLSFKKQTDKAWRTFLTYMHVCVNMSAHSSLYHSYQKDGSPGLNDFFVWVHKEQVCINVFSCISNNFCLVIWSKAIQLFGVFLTWLVCLVCYQCCFEHKSKNIAPQRLLWRKSTPTQPDPALCVFRIADRLKLQVFFFRVKNHHYKNKTSDKTNLITYIGWQYQ